MVHSKEFLVLRNFYDIHINISAPQPRGRGGMNIHPLENTLEGATTSPAVCIFPSTFFLI